jgi:hypothetical protein
MSKKSQHSNYWADVRFANKYEKNTPEYLLRLSNVRRGVASFVKIHTGSDIPVVISSGSQSYTDGEKTVVISACTDADELDSMVGVGLHEGSHVRWSQPLFHFLRSLKANESMIVPADIPTLAGAIGRTMEVTRDLLLLLNIIEDRRIDRLSYEVSPGYRPYYAAFYETHFYSELVQNELKSELLRTPHWDAYRAQLLNIQSKEFDPTALPGLQEMAELIDLDHISRLDKDAKWETWMHHKDNLSGALKYTESEYPEIIRLAFQLQRLIYKNIDANAQSIADEMKEKIRKFQEMMAKMMADMEKAMEHKDGLENWDMPDECNGAAADSEEGMKRLAKRLGKQIMTTNGKIDKQKMDASQKQTMDSLETSKADLREVGEDEFKGAKCPVIVYKAFTKDIASSGRYPFASTHIDPYSAAAVSAGRKMAEILAHKLRVMNDETTEKYTRQENGKIDPRLIHQLGFSTGNVFSQEKVVRVKPVMVDVSIDSSGSMSGGKWQSALTLATTLAYAAKKIRSLRVRISLRHGEHSTAVVGIVYDSAVDDVTKITALFPYLHVGGGTPEGLAFEAIQAELLEGVKNTTRYFVNLSDGVPEHGFTPIGKSNWLSYTGEGAFNHTARQVKKLRESGVHVLSFFIAEGNATHYKSQFRKMYGNTATFVNTRSVPQIAFALNKMFLAGQ